MGRRVWARRRRSSLFATPTRSRMRTGARGTRCATIRTRDRPRRSQAAQCRADDPRRGASRALRRHVPGPTGGRPSSTRSSTRRRGSDSFCARPLCPQIVTATRAFPCDSLRPVLLLVRRHSAARAFLRDGHRFVSFSIRRHFAALAFPGESLPIRCVCPMIAAVYVYDPSFEFVTSKSTIIDR